MESCKKIPVLKLLCSKLSALRSQPSAPCSKPSQPLPESLSKKVVRGGIWVFALRIINHALGFIRTVILARLLAPSDFGHLGVAMLLAIGTLETFSQTGFQAVFIYPFSKKWEYLEHLL